MECGRKVHCHEWKYANNKLILSEILYGFDPAKFVIFYRLCRRAVEHLEPNALIHIFMCCGFNEVTTFISYILHRKSMLE